MSQNKEKIENLLNLLKIKVENPEIFEKDFDSILKMFDEIKDINVDGIEAKLSKKKVKLDDLRVDEQKDFPGFENKIKGTYFKVPSVSKK